MDYMGLTIEEEKAIEKLKERLENELKPEQRKDDLMLLRFLKARDFNSSKAEDMLRHHLEWRNKFDIDDIHNYVPPECGDYFPLSLIAFSKSGNPVRYLSFGSMDTRGLLKSCKRIDNIKTVVQQLEADCKQMKEIKRVTGQNIDQWIYVFDFENFTFAKATHKPTIQMLAYLMMIYESHYPERLKQAFCINASVYFTLIFSIIKPLFSGKTLSKVKIYGKEGWQEELLQFVEAEDLPAFLGGQRKDPDGNPKCPSIVNMGGLIPEELFLRCHTKRLCHQPDVKKLQVSRLSKVNLELDVKEPGSHIEWEFETENKDIGFGLYYQELNSLRNKPKELIPKQRVESHISSEIGMFKCDAPGTYILMFDNSYSWLQQKEIFCRAVVVRPTADKKTCLQ